MNNQEEPLAIGVVAQAQQDVHPQAQEETRPGGEEVEEQDISMVVLPEERDWAHDIKRAVQEAEHLDPLSDFDYVHYAIVTQGNLQDALYRIEGIQACKREYHIENTVDQGVEQIRLHMDEVVPGFLLHVDLCPVTNEPICVLDNAAFFPKFIKAGCPRRGPDYYWKTYLVASYYIMMACQPTMEAIRGGLTIILDCAEVEWKNVSMAFESQVNDELRSFYPQKYKTVLAYNTHVISNLGWSLFKQYMDESMKATLKLGCKILEPEFAANMEGVETPTRLRELFLQPTKEIARVNLLRRVRELLTLREENVRNFKL